MKKRVRNRIIIAAVMVMLVAVSSLGSFYVAYNIFQGKSLFYKSNNISFSSSASADEIAKFKDIKRKITNDFFKKYNENDLVEGALKGMVEALNDPYTRYYTKEEMDSRNHQLSGYYYGVGVVISEQTKDYLFISKVTANTPASEAGLQPGDKIHSINGKNVSDFTSGDILADFKKDGSKVDIGYIRGSDKLSVTLTVRAINIQSVSSRKLDDNIGYIRITQFDTNAANGFENALNVLIGQGIKGLIIDLRNNGGGLASEMSRIADTLLPEGKMIYYEVDKNGNKEEIKYSDANSVKIPITVLINGNTASASELLSSTLRDNAGAKLIGLKSFGKAIGQETIIQKDGSGLVITTSQFFTPSGYNIQGAGLKPDIEVALPDEFKDKSVEDIPSDKDDQLNEAIDTLMSAGG